MNMATQANANPVAVIRQNLEVMAPELKAALPKHVTVEKFSRVAMTAIQQNPDLVAADRRSLFGAVVRLAQDGLLPDGREAALVIFNTKNRSGGWDKKVQAMPMIAGVLKKIRQSGDVAKVGAQVVCENDHFVWKLGFDEDVEHAPPALDKPRGKVIGAYATAVLKDGSRLLEVMSLEEIEKVRAVSKSKDKGPWVSWFEEMARKTVMRRLSKRLPMSTDLEDEVFSRDETLAHVEDKREFEVIEGGAAAPVSRLDALEHHIEDEGEFTEADTEVVDAETGEVEPEVSPTEEKLANIRNSIAAAKNDKGLAAIDGEWVKARAAYDDETASEIDGLIAERRKELAE
jgi:recombination protein RecT